MVDGIQNMSFLTHNGYQIPKVPTELCWADRWGGWKARWAIGRMSYIVDPGLYAVGNPDGGSPVFVSANYKMSFDCLRSQLTGRDGWILVLDTKGINVWCAAGKGTFGTEELVGRIEEVQLGDIVEHKTLIVPQLGAVGVSAHKVKRQSGFTVVYGPVRAEDLPAFLDAGMKATEQMRRVTFPLKDRIVLIPVELMTWGKQLVLVAVCFLLLAGLSPKGYSTDLVMSDGIQSVLILLAGFLAAGVLGPVLLPWLPGRSFSVKGLWIGFGMLLLGGFLLDRYTSVLDDRFNMAAWALIVPALTSFVVLNFTGASTYTSLSGVKREVKIAVPLQIVCAVFGIGLWMAGRFI
ncbi:mercury methylation corrinoid protein HgcA [Planctomycetota bacterium]